LANKCSGFQPDVVRVLACSKLGDDGDPANEAKVFLNFDVIQNNLIYLAEAIIGTRKGETYTIDDFEQL